MNTITYLPLVDSKPSAVEFLRQWWKSQDFSEENYALCVDALKSGRQRINPGLFEDVILKKETTIARFLSRSSRHVVLSENYPVVDRVTQLAGCAKNFVYECVLFYLTPTLKKFPEELVTSQNGLIEISEVLLMTCGILSALEDAIAEPQCTIDNDDFYTPSPVVKSFLLDFPKEKRDKLIDNLIIKAII